METTDYTNPIVFIQAAGTVRPLTEKLTYSAAEAAALIGVSRPAIYRMIARRVLTPLPGLRHKRIPKKQILNLAKRRDWANPF